MKKNILEILTDSGCCNSRGEARRLVRAKGIRVDGIQVNDEQGEFETDDIKMVSKYQYKHYEVK